MEFRCSNCQHIGPAAELRPTESGVALICEVCGHANPLDMGGAASPAPAAPDVAAPDAADSAAPAPPAAPAPEPPASKKVELSEAVVARLIPEPGEGLRCPKCAHRVESHDEHCARCGLGLRDAEQYAPGEAPWERPPEGKEAAYEHALSLFEAARQDWSAEKLEQFTALVMEESLHEVGIRWLRFHLIDCPEDELAIEQLKLLASKMQSRLVVAEAQAQASAQQFEAGVTQLRSRLLVFIGIFWTLTFTLFFSLFIRSCGG